MKKTVIFLLTAIAVMATASLALAADPQVSAAGLGTIGMIALGAGIGIGIGTLGPGIGQGIAVSGALQGMARNPEATNSIRTYMIVGLAIMESLTIYALVVALILIYAFPFADTIKGLF